MSRSIKVYRYRDSDTSRNIFRKLNTKKFIKTNTHVENHSAIIQYSITQIRETNSVVTGRFTYTRLIRWRETDQSIICKYDFTISPSNGFLIIHGKDMNYHKPVLIILSRIIHQESHEYFFYPIKLEKYIINDLHIRLTDQSDNNRMLRPRFKNANANKDLERDFNDFSLVLSCATLDGEYTQRYNESTMLEPIWQIDRCIGLANIELPGTTKLSIKEDCYLSFGLDIPNEDWDVFIFELLIEVLPR